MIEHRNPPPPNPEIERATRVLRAQTAIAVAVVEHLVLRVTPATEEALIVVDEHDDGCPVGDYLEATKGARR